GARPLYRRLPASRSGGPRQRCRGGALPESSRARRGVARRLVAAGIAWASEPRRRLRRTGFRRGRSVGAAGSRVRRRPRRAGGSADRGGGARRAAADCLLREGERPAADSAAQRRKVISVPSSPDRAAVATAGGQARLRGLRHSKRAAAASRRARALLLSRPAPRACIASQSGGLASGDGVRKRGDALGVAAD